MIPREYSFVSKIIEHDFQIQRTRLKADEPEWSLEERRWIWLREDCPIEWAGPISVLDGCSQFYLACQHHEGHERPENTIMRIHVWIEKTHDSETRTIVYVGQCPLCLTIFYALREVEL
jgi:hypothetical protein